MRTYDIINAGPRNRFMANGKIVSNSARGVQLQNLPRPQNEDVDSIITAILAQDIPRIETVWGSPMAAVADCIRGMIAAPPGKVIYCADFSAIEARVLPWLAGEHGVLDVFRTGADIYCHAASPIFGFPVNKKDHPNERQVGKTSCVSEGELVLTDAGLVAIENVTRRHRVWDGLDFVQHGGVVFQGFKEVIHYDGLTATEDHLVWVEGQHHPVHFGLAASSGSRLVRSEIGGAAVRVGRNYTTREEIPQWVVGGLRRGSVYRMRERKLGSSREFVEGCLEGMPALLSTPESSRVVKQARSGHEAEVPARRTSQLRELRRARDRISFFVRHGMLPVDCREYGTSARHGSGPREQRRALRTREFKMGYPPNTNAEHTGLRVDRRDVRMGRAQEPLFLLSDTEADVRGALYRGHNFLGQMGGVGSAEKLDGYPRKAGTVRVYDIANAGPNHRFTVSGRLVHNCLALGFAGGIGAFGTFAKSFGIDMAPVLPRLNATEMEIKKAEKSYNRYVRSVADPMGLEAGLASDVIKQRWRKANSATVALWAALNEAAINAVENPGKAFKAGEHLTYKMAGNWLFCRLPSGRCLAYPSPRIRYEEVEFETDEGEIKVFKAKGVRYMGVNSITRKWSEMRLGSHTLAENCTQSVARDLMVEAALRLDAAGYDVALTVHDEVIAYADEGTGSVEDFCGIMAEVPAWATDCPIAAEGWVGKRYRK